MEDVISAEEEAEIAAAWVQALGSEYPEDRQEAVQVLVQWVCEAFGDEGVALGALVRDQGGVRLLLQMWGDANAGVQEMALLVLGNLCSDSVDAKSSLTKAELLKAPLAAKTLLACMKSKEQGVMVMACAALQNLCHDVAWAHAVVAANYLPRLEELVRHTDKRVVQYVAGALLNMHAQCAHLLDPQATIAACAPHAPRTPCPLTLGAACATRRRASSWRG